MGPMSLCCDQPDCVPRAASLHTSLGQGLSWIPVQGQVGSLGGGDWVGPTGQRPVSYLVPLVPLPLENTCFLVCTISVFWSRVKDQRPGTSGLWPSVTLGCALPREKQAAK